MSGVSMKALLRERFQEVAFYIYVEIKPIVHLSWNPKIDRVKISLVIFKIKPRDLVVLVGMANVKVRKYFGKIFFVHEENSVRL